MLRAHASPKTTVKARKETVQGAKPSAQKMKAREDSPITTDSAVQILSPNMRSRRTEECWLIGWSCLRSCLYILRCQQISRVRVCVFWLSVKRDSVSIVLGILFAVDFSHVTEFGMGKVVKL